MWLTVRKAATAVTAGAVALAAVVLAAGAPASAGVTAVPLASALAADILVDDAHQRLYVSVPSLSQVLVRTLDGAAVATVGGISKPGELALSPDGAYVYAVQQNATAIARISTADHSLTKVTFSGGCLLSLAATGGDVWFTYTACFGGSTGGLGVIDSDTGAVTTFENGSGLPMARAMPNHPERLVLVGHEGVQVHVYDVSSGTPVAVVKGTANLGGGGNCRDAGVFAGGTRVVIACGAPYEHRVFDTLDLSPEGAFPSDAYPNAVAISPDDRYVAAGISGWYEPDVYVYDAADGVPGTWLRTYEVAGYAESTVTNALAWSADGRLYAVSEPTDGNIAYLHILTNAQQPQPLLRVGPASAVISATPGGFRKLVVTGTVSCDETTVVDLTGNVSQTGTNMSYTASVDCTAGVARAWTAEVPSAYVQYYEPVETTVTVSARARNPEYGTYTAVSSSTFELRVRLSSPFGRRG